MQYFSVRNLHVPKKVSIISNDGDASLDWCNPPVSHFKWDSRALVRRVMRWAVKADRGLRDVEHSIVPATFVSGSTIGPASK
jgi:DNA-binding LacI/PurR family transcriptional regulator